MIREWRDIKTCFRNAAVLIGNGSSCVVHDGFRYQSLFDKAFTNGDGAQSRSVFKEFGTRDFELVLRHVQSAERVLQAVEGRANGIAALHEQIQNGLIRAVKAVHLPWSDFRGRACRYHQALAPYRIIFSLNYDLLAYWEIMDASKDPVTDSAPSGISTTVEMGPVKDGSWSLDHTFQWNNAAPWDRSTRMIYYLHGGLHLERLEDGTTRKRVSDEGSNLLDGFGPNLEVGTTPLFVSEGTADNKMRAIHNNDYLTWAYDQLADAEGPLVIFGAGLDGPDQHIADAINRSNADPIAFSVYQSEGIDPNAEAKKRSAAFPKKLVRLYKSESHPLGSPSLALTLPAQPR